MSINPAQVQRLNTFIAALEPKFDEVTEAFFVRFEKACAGAKCLRRGHGRRGRHEFAASVAMVLKNLDNLEAARAVFTFAGDRWRELGLGASEIQAARACLVSVLREGAGAAWTSETERDVNTLIGECFDRFEVGGSKQQRAAA